MKINKQSTDSHDQIHHLFSTSSAQLSQQISASSLSDLEIKGRR